MHGVVTLGSERDDMDVPLVAQQMFDAIADAEHGRAVRLREIEVLELRVHLDEGAADPAIESFGVGADASGRRPGRCGRDRGPVLCRHSRSDRPKHWFVVAGARVLPHNDWSISESSTERCRFVREN